MKDSETRQLRELKQEYEAAKLQGHIRRFWRLRVEYLNKQAELYQRRKGQAHGR